MEIFSTAFLSALLAIIVIDLVLAGDNAIVIALAARKLPRAQQRRAIAWGTVGAVVVRSAMTVAVVWLLKVPGLMLAGGVALVWIACRLLVEEPDDGGHDAVAATTFWGAMRTIVVADAIMGLDNVLAVAGAAHGSYLLVVLGLLVSVPIVVWGSTLILRWVERFPAIVYLGAGVLAWTAAKMMLGEPLLRELVDADAAIAPLVYVLVIGAVLGSGWWRARARSAPVGGRANASSSGEVEVGELVTLAGLATGSSSMGTNGGLVMQRILVPVDGSRSARAAVRHLVALALGGERLDVQVLNVQRPFSRHIARFSSPESRRRWHAAAAARELDGARRALSGAGIAHQVHERVGEPATTIAAEADRLGCSRIVMGTERKSALSRAVEDSVSTRVVAATRVPVELIAGAAPSAFVRWGLPAGLGAALALLLMAAD